MADKKIVNLDVPMVGLDGTKVEGATGKLGSVLASSLAMAQSDDPIKFFDWAVKLYAGTNLELDSSDFIKLKEFIDGADLRNLPKAQILKVLASL